MSTLRFPIPDRARRMAFALAFLVSCATAAPSPRDTVLDYDALSGDFAAMVSADKPFHRMPRLTDPHEGGMLRQLSDHRRFLDPVAFGQADLDSLQHMCGKARDLMVQYMNFDRGGAAPPSGSEQAIEANMKEFQDELGLVIPFTVRCVARELPLVAQFAKTLKPGDMDATRRDGLRKMREGSYAMYSSFLQISNSPEMKASFRSNILDGLADTAPAIAPIMPVENRARVAQFARSILPKSPATIQGDLRRIAEAMSKPGCEGLCAIR